jgi:hypothetical protein
MVVILKYYLFLFKSKKKIKGWIAGKNDFFNNVTLSFAAKKYCSLKGVIKGRNGKKFKSKEKLPDSYDLRVIEPMCVHPVRDQAQWLLK